VAGLGGCPYAKGASGNVATEVGGGGVGVEGVGVKGDGVRVLGCRGWVLVVWL